MESIREKGSATDHWQRTRHLQIAIVRTTLFMIVILTGFLAAMTFRPIRKSLQRRDLEEFRTRSMLIHSRVAGFFEQSRQTACQIPSRTRIREELIAYLEGERTLESYTAFTESKIEDALEASEGILGVMRFDPEMKPLVGVGLTAGEIPCPCPVTESPTLLPAAGEIDGETVVFYHLPIIQSGYGLAGYDIVAVSLSPLEEWLHSRLEEAADAAVVIFDETAFDSARPILSSDMPPEKEGTLANLATDLLSDGGGVGGSSSFEAFVHGIAPGWNLLVARESEELYGNARRETNILGSVVLLIGLVSAATAFFVQRILSRRTLAETGALEEVVEEQTKELRMLLREVHHRIKNDIYLTNSFIEIKAAESASEEAREVLTKAVSSLQTMGELYSLMEAGDDSPIDVRDIVGKIGDRIEANADAGGVSIRLDAEKIPIPAALVRPIAIIVNELATNALKYAGGVEDPRIVISIRRTDPGKIELAVADNGPGFPEDVLSGRSGIGLEMARTMASRYNGMLNLSNDDGARAALTLELPEET